MIARHPTKGWFARRGEIVVLRARDGTSWPMERVTFLQRFGSVDEGGTKLPRPFEYDATGRETVKGDMVLIEFPDGNPNEPVVVGTAVDCTAISFLQRTYAADGSGFNRLAVRVAPRDATDRELGHVEVEVSRLNDGGVELRASDSLDITVGSGAQQVSILAKDGKLTITANVEVVVDAPSVKLGTAASEGVLKGLTAQGIFDTHTHGTPFGPTITPAASMSPAVSTVVDTA